MSEHFSQFIITDIDSVSEDEGRYQISLNQQRIYRFPNNRGASVVRRLQVSPVYRYILWGTYGAEDYLWELAAHKFEGEDWIIDYDSGITEDVIGYLTEEEVQGYLVRIKALPEHSFCKWDEPTDTYF